MGFRSLFLALFIALIAPSYANALDIFEFFDNALNGKTGSVSQPDQQIEEDEDWSNAIVIDLNPKPVPPPQLPPQQIPQQLPPPQLPPQQQIPPPAKPVPAPIPVPIPRPIPQELPPPQLPPQQQGKFEVKPPEIFKEKVLEVEAERNIPNWKGDKRAHWEFQLLNYYGRYLGGEASMARLERETKLFENSLFYDLNKAASLNPNKYNFPLNGVAGGKLITEFYTRTWTSYDLVLCRIPHEVKSSLSPQGKIDALAWNKAFSTLASGPGAGISRQFSNDAELAAGIESLCVQAGVQNCNKEFKDAVQSSAGKWDEKQHSEQVESTRQADAKTSVKWRIEPLIYFNLDFEKKIVNQTPYANEPDLEGKIPFTKNFAGNGNQQPIPERILLRPASPAHGYDIYQSSTLGLGGGVGIQSVIDWASPSWAWLKQANVFAGGMITKTESRGSARRVEPNDPTPEQLRALMAQVTEVQAINHYGKNPNEDVRTQFIYPRVGNISNWKIGESYNFTLRGGFMLTGGISWMAVAMGPTYVREGSAQHNITKIAEDKVMVEVTKFEAVSGSAALAAGILSFSEVIKNNVSRVKKTYFYDLGMEVGRRAFTQLMIGNYYDTQVLVALNETVAVALVERDVSKTYLDRKAGDFMSSWYIGIPFVYWNWFKGKTTEEGMLTDFVDSIETRYFHGMFFDNYHRRILFDHKYVTAAFYSGIENSGLRPLRRTDNQDYYGRYFWNFQDESADRKTLRKALNKMIYFQTGLEELEVDERLIKKDDIGYTNAEVIVDLNKDATDALIRNAAEGGGPDLIAAYHQAVNHFANTNYPEDLDYCDTTFEINGYRNIYTDGHEHYQNKALAKKECVEFIRARFLPDIHQMIRHLIAMREMANSSQDAKKKIFAQEYAKFGRLMMKNRFTFRAVYNFIADAGLGDFVRYTINGESLANMVIYFPSGKIGRPMSLINR